ncbi:hypothetical protein [Ruegeria jejuensis]|uniref:hypothetical protein n=1 Tax=Ruegeria jejuensis TaxID=3233338 RepID=UPI00355BDF79
MAHALDHWRIKLLTLTDDRLTDARRALAEQKKALMLGFLRDLATEVDSAIHENCG